MSIKIASNNRQRIPGFLSRHWRPPRPDQDAKSWTKRRPGASEARRRPMAASDARAVHPETGGWRQERHTAKVILMHERLHSMSSGVSYRLHLQDQEPNPISMT